MKWTATRTIWAVGVLLYEMVQRNASVPGRRTPAVWNGRSCRAFRRRALGEPLPDRAAGGRGQAAGSRLRSTATKRAEAIRQDLEHITSGDQTRAEQEGWPDRAADEQADAPHAIGRRHRRRSDAANDESR